jgi:hypothetical protein
MYMASCSGQAQQGGSLAQQCPQHGVLTLISLASWHTAHGALHRHEQLDVSCSGVSHVQADA